MASTIQIRVDDDLKNKSDQLFKDLGTEDVYKRQRCCCAPLWGFLY